MKIYILLFLIGFTFAQFGGGESIVKGSKKAPLQQDSATDALTQISYEHHEIHSGSSYSISIHQVLGDGDTLKLAIVCPDTKAWAHMLFGMSSSGILQKKVIEGGAFTGGDTLTIFNQDRNSSNTSGLLMVRNPKITREGACIDSALWGDRKLGGGESRGGHEKILAQDSTYFLYGISGAATNRTTFEPHWYEHTNKP